MLSYFYDIEMIKVLPVFSIEKPSNVLGSVSMVIWKTCNSIVAQVVFLQNNCQKAEIAIFTSHIVVHWVYNIIKRPIV